MDKIMRIGVQLIAFGTLTTMLVAILYEESAIRSHDDYYRILQCSPSSSKTDIQRSYRRLAAIYHPDKVAAASTRKYDAQKFYTIQKAWSILKDPDKRALYDLHELGGSCETESRFLPFLSFRENSEVGRMLIGLLLLCIINYLKRFLLSCI